ncbi:MAG: O-antigen ligase family protein [Bacteroidales bacterium]|nr:O-antigen ligase family protein [Bacteroidales bacterium]
MLDLKKIVCENLTLWQRVEFAIVLLMAFLVPISWRIATFALVLWVVAAVVRSIAERGQVRLGASKIRRKWWYLLFAMFYVIHCVSMFYTENLAEGWATLEKRLSFLLLPLVFLIFDFSYLGRENVRKVLWAFTLGILAVVCADLLSAAWDVLFRGAGTSRFFDVNLSSEHHTYISMHICVGIIVCFVELVRGKGKPLWQKLLLVLALALFTVATVLLSSRAGLLCMVAVYFFLFLWMIFGRKMYRAGIVTAVVAVVGVGVIAMAFPNSLERVTNTAKSLFSSERTEDVRVTILRSTVPVALDNWLTGVGVGDKIDAYMEQYRKDGNQIPLEREYNSHNQFVDTTTVTGILGLALMLCFFVVPAVLAIRDRRFDVVFALFLFVIFFNALFESVFEKQAGIMFFVLLFVAMFNAEFVAEKKEKD